MAHDAERQALLEFLDEHVFDPVLRVSPDRVDRREAFEDAQSRIARTKAYCHACRTAEDIRSLCVAAVESAGGCRADRELDRLGLPTLSRMARRLQALCDELGIGASELKRASL